ncbi:hypothetical protein UFOVP3_38 [uncultured Caudovirales phage]|uniref:Uncharacterized protein n=1 Tax=uncultured Caudovirales phage TaxID=2100421 RepID=A0A6J5TAP2_9CAUD|nr:hypothetical protein UFOVP3_38 [uncultured Caudovirales phage]
MADLLDIVLGIDTSQIKTAKQEIAELGNSFNSATKSASIFEQAFARAAAQSAKDAAFLRDAVRANQELINTNLGVTNSYKSAEQSASAFGMVLNNIDRASKAFAANFNGVVGITGGRATSNGAGFGALADEIDRLGQKYNSVYASSKLYENTLNELNRAVMLGVISDKQREASLEALNSQMATGTGIFKNYSQQLGNNASRMGTIFQQTGYQVSDFIVQVQSGTNPLVAFSQQATQLVGALYALPPAFLATEVSIIGLEVTVSTLIAGFTIIVPLVTAIAAAFMRSGDSTKKAKEEVDLYTKAVSGLASEIQKNQDKFALFKFGGDQGTASAKQEKESLQKQIKIAEEKLVSNLTSKTSVALDPLGTILSSIENATIGETANLNEQITTLKTKLNLVGAQDEAQRMLNGGLSVAGGLQKAWLLTQQESKRTQEEANGLIADANQKAIYDANQSIMVKRQEAELQRLILEDGKNSNQVYEQKALMAKLAAEQAEREKFAKDGISATEQDLITKAGEQAYIHEKNAGLIEQQTQNAQNLAAAFKDVSSAMKGMTSFIDDMDKALNEVNIKVSLMEKGIKASVAGTVATKQAKLDEVTKGMNEAGFNPAIVGAYSQKGQGLVDQYLTASSKAEELASAQNKKSGPSTDSVENKLKTLYKYLDETRKINSYVTEEEAVALQQRLDTLKLSLDKGLITRSEYLQLESELRVASEQETQDKIEALQSEAASRSLQQRQAFMETYKGISTGNLSDQLGGWSSYFDQLNNLSGGHYKKLAQAAKIFAAGQALVNSYLAYTQVIADPLLPWFAKIGAAAGVLAAGLGAVAAIKGGGSGGGGSSGGGKSVGSMPSSAMGEQTAAPQVVMIQGLKPTDVFTGEQLSTLFDSLYKENRNRGMVFQVAR